MPKASDMKGAKLRARVRFLRMTFPRSGHMSGDFAICAFMIRDIIDGELPLELTSVSMILAPEIVAKGNMPTMTMGVDYIFQGTLVIDPKYGPQYQVDMLRLDYDMADKEDQKKFFKIFMTEKQVEALFADNNNPMKWLEEHDTKKLCTIKGIGPVTAQRMCDRYDECKDNSHAYIELQGYGMTKAAIDRIVARYGSPDIAVDRIKQNPYILIRDVKGYGWNKADAIARAQGFSRDCKERTMAYAQFFLESEADDNGHSWVSIDVFLNALAAECRPEDPTKVNNWVKNCLYMWVKDEMCGEDEFAQIVAKPQVYRKSDGYPLLYYDKKERRVGLTAIRLLEHDIATNLKRIKDAPSSQIFDDREIKKAIVAAENEQGFSYSAEQRRAIELVLDSNVSIITGPGGSGKSTLLNAVTKVFKNHGLRVEQCALSGRASSKLSEITHVSGVTIHRLLAYDDENGGFRFNAANQLPADVVILDETSMVGGELFFSLISAIRSGSRFIMVGDHHQLEAIGLANVFKDCLTASNYIPSAILTEIHRQAQKSGIIVQSIRASNGEKMVDSNFVGEETRGELRDFKIVCSLDPAFTQNNIITEYRRLLSAGVKPDDIQIIVPQRLRGNISCYALNNKIQALVNPSFSPKNRTVHFKEEGAEYDITFKIGDKVIVTKNDYRALRPDGSKVAIFNGNVGHITDMSAESMTISLLGQGEVMVSRDKWSNISLAYAITCHKKQGDQVPYAIIGLDTSAYAMFSKEWVYTAISRASKYCVFVTQPNAINKAVKISRVKKKQTWLKEFLFALGEGKEI